LKLFFEGGVRYLVVVVVVQYLELFPGVRGALLDQDGVRTCTGVVFTRFKGARVGFKGEQKSRFKRNKRRVYIAKLRQKTRVPGSRPLFCHNALRWE